MDWMTFIADIIGSVAWPASALFALWIFRGAIRNAIPNLKQLKYGDLQVNFGREVESLKEDIAEEEDFSQLLVPQRTIDLAKISPRAAILDTWLKVEKSALNAVRRHNIIQNASSLQSGTMAVKLLLDHNLIDQGTYNMFNNLRLLRNEAVHANDREIETIEAINTCDMCFRLIRRLDDA